MNATQWLDEIKALLAKIDSNREDYEQAIDNARNGLPTDELTNLNADEYRLAVSNLKAAAPDLLRQAVEEIERLEGENEALHSHIEMVSDALQPFAQFANIQARDHEYVTISVKINDLQAARRVLGGAYHGDDTENIPL